MHGYDNNIIPIIYQLNLIFSVWYYLLGFHLLVKKIYSKIIFIFNGKKKPLKNDTKMLIWMYNECKSLISRHKITLDWLTCH